MRLALIDEKKMAHAAGKSEVLLERLSALNEASVFFISLKAGGVGLNLTSAEYCFILDPWWNPASEAQAIDRIHSIGQKNKVFAYRLVTKDTVEEKILQLQDKKRSLYNDVVDYELETQSAALGTSARSQKAMKSLSQMNRADIEFLLS